VGGVLVGPRSGKRIIQNKRGKGRFRAQLAEGKGVNSAGFERFLRLMTVELGGEKYQYNRRTMKVSCVEHVPGKAHWS